MVADDLFQRAKALLRRLKNTLNIRARVGSVRDIVSRLAEINMTAEQLKWWLEVVAALAGIGSFILALFQVVA